MYNYFLNMDCYISIRTVIFIVLFFLCIHGQAEFNYKHFTVEDGYEFSAGIITLTSRNVSSKLSCARLCAESTLCCKLSFDDDSMCLLVEDCFPALQPSGTSVVLTKDGVSAPCVHPNTQLTDCTDLPTTCPRGVYHVFPPNSVNGIDVFCETNGWTVVQRRLDGSVDFFRDWVSYKDGFGNIAGEYWIGNENLHQYTNSRPYTLRIEVEDFHGEQRWAEYTTFLVGSETTNYQLTVAGYGGTTGDLMDYSNGQQFTTTDRDHDTWGAGACTSLRGGCFWYGYCTFTNLNGRYYILSNVGTATDTIYVWPWKSGTSDPMKKTSMMIK